MSVRMELKKIENRYFDEVNKVADFYFVNVVVPYCKRYKLDFTSGMGSWNFNTTNDTPKTFRESHCMLGGDYKTQVIRSTLPEKILEILEEPLPMNGYELGAHMSDYRHN